MSINKEKRGQQALPTETRTVTGRTETQKHKKNQQQTSKQTEVNRLLGLNYAVAKQPGDSSKESFYGRFPSLREGIHPAVCVCVRAHSGVCLRVCVSLLVSRVRVDTVSLQYSGMWPAC